MTDWRLFLILDALALANLAGLGEILLDRILAVRIANTRQPCPDCDDKGWRQMIHLSGAPDAETCPTCHNPHNHPCPWSLP